jgi:hypothetical protein
MIIRSSKRNTLPKSLVHKKILQIIHMMLLSPDRGENQERSEEPEGL